MKHVSIRAIILSGLFALGTVYSTQSLAKYVEVWHGRARSTLTVPAREPQKMNAQSGKSRKGTELVGAIASPKKPLDVEEFERY